MKIIKRLFRASRRKDPRRVLLAAARRRGGAEQRVAEIGVWKGDFSALILREIAPRKLHLIDPWKFYGEYPHRRYGGRIARNQDDMDEVFRVVQDRFRDHPAVVIHRETAGTVLPDFDDDYFDWVYVDGNHSYEFVLADLRMCLPKMKRGGIIAGDDYEWGPEWDYPVRRAVTDFCQENNLNDNLEIIGSQYSIEVTRP